jgi:hypothetical protein
VSIHAFPLNAAPAAGPRSLHAICELARLAACGACPASGLESPCVQSRAADGFHLARFADARRRGWITAADFGAVAATVTVITNSAVIYDDTFEAAA